MVLTGRISLSDQNPRQSWITKYLYSWGWRLTAPIRSGVLKFTCLQHNDTTATAGSLCIMCPLGVQCLQPLGSLGPGYNGAAHLGLCPLFRRNELHTTESYCCISSFVTRNQTMQRILAFLWSKGKSREPSTEKTKFIPNSKKHTRFLTWCWNNLPNSAEVVGITLLGREA